MAVEHGSETAAGKIIKPFGGLSSNSRYHINQVSPIKHLAATLSNCCWGTDGYRMSLRKTPEELGKVLSSYGGWFRNPAAVDRWFIHMGVSENSVPLNPMVNDHYPY